MTATKSLMPCASPPWFASHCSRRITNRMRSPTSNSDSVPPPNIAPQSNFFSSGLRQKIDQLMDILWAGGVNNPMDSIEQISYLLFLRLLTEKDELLASLDKKYTRIFSGKWARYAWGNFVTLTGDN